VISALNLISKSLIRLHEFLLTKVLIMFFQQLLCIITIHTIHIAKLILVFFEYVFYHYD